MSENLKVEMVKKGDVLFLLDSVIEGMNELLSRDENSQVDWVNNGNELLKEWYDGRIASRSLDIYSLTNLRNQITNLK